MATGRSRATVKAVTGTDTVTPPAVEEGPGTAGTPVEGNANEVTENVAPEEKAEENAETLDSLMAQRAELLAWSEEERPDGFAEEMTRLEEKISAIDPFILMDEAVEQTEFKRGPASVDYEEITSPRIKMDLLKSFNKYEAPAVPGKPGKTAWLTQRFPNANMAEAYFNQAKKYAQFKGWTFRSAWMKDVNGTLVNVKADDTVKPSILRFAAKPKEVRTRSN